MMIHCKIVTPSGVYKEFDTSILNIVNSDGQRGILPNHMPLVTTLVISKMSTVESNGRQEYAIGGGLLHFENNVAMILVDSIEHSSEIDKDRALRAKKRALGHLESADPNTDVLRAETALKRALNRLNVAGK